jgi:hypothetical protein
MKPADDIPYDEIDANIRPLVRLLNEQDEFRTSESCAGHDDGGPRGTYVTVGVRGYEGLIALAKALMVLENTREVDILSKCEFLWFMQVEDGENITPGWLWFDVCFQHEDKHQVLTVAEHEVIVKLLAEHFRVVTGGKNA